MHLCDSHCHLESNRFTTDRDKVITRAFQAGVRLLVSCGTDLDTSREQLAFTRQYAGVYTAVGIHGHRANSVLRLPEDASSVVDEDLISQLRQLAGSPGVVALGELGLDYHYEFSPRAVQRKVLKRQLELSSELDMPVILHNRESDTDLMDLVDEVPPVHGVLHCFLGSDALLDWALARGFYIGVAGPITFTHMGQLIGQLKRVPPDRLLVETDSPYLAPQPVRGRRNEPANVTYIVEKLSQVLQMEITRIAQITFDNTLACFGIRDAG